MRFCVRRWQRMTGRSRPNCCGKFSARNCARRDESSGTALGGSSESPNDESGRCVQLLLLYELAAPVLRAAGLAAVGGDGRQRGDALCHEARGRHVVGAGQCLHHRFGALLREMMAPPSRLLSPTTAWRVWQARPALRPSGADSVPIATVGVRQAVDARTRLRVGAARSSR